MARVQYAFVTSAAAPFCRLLKFLDGVPSVISAFPFASNPAALTYAEFSPDGKYLAAAAAASSVNPVRLWEKISEDEFVEIPLPAHAAARQATGLAWMTNNHLVFCASNGMFFGVLDRVAKTVTWSNPSTLAFTGLSAHPGGTDLIGLRVNNFQWFNRSGNTLSTASGTLDATSVPWAEGVFKPDGSLWFGANSNPTGGTSPRRYSNTRTLVADTTITHSLVNNSAKLHIWSRKKPFCHVASKDTPYLRYGNVPINSGASVAVHLITQVSGAPSIPAVLNSIAEIETMEDVNDLILAAVNSSTLGSGRVRGFLFDYSTLTYTEDSSISDLFDNWNATPSWVTTSAPENTNELPVKFYDDSIEDLVNGVVDLTSLKVALLSATAVFDGSDSTLAEVLGANEVYGSSWPQGGVQTLPASYERTGDAADYALLVEVPPVDLISSGSLTFRSGVIYDDSRVGKPPLVFIDFGENKTAAQFDRIVISSRDGRLALFSANN